MGQIVVQATGGLSALETLEAVMWVPPTGDSDPVRFARPARRVAAVSVCPSLGNSSKRMAVP